MTAQSIVCGACAAEVPYGRLSCPSCGELLASVAGSRRAATSGAARSAVPDMHYEPPASQAVDVVDGKPSIGHAPRNVEDELPWTETTTEAADAADASLGGHTTTAVPFGTAAGLNGSKTPSYMPRPGSRQSATRSVAPTPEADPMPAPLFDPADLADQAPAVTLDAAADRSAAEPEWPASSAAPEWPAPTTAPEWPAPTAAPEWPAPFAAPEWPAPVAQAQAVPAPAPAASATLAAAVATPQAYAGPGAYLPPTPMPVAAVPAGMPAPAREWAGHAGEEIAAPDPSTGGIRIDGDARARLLDFTRWLSVAGSAFAAVGFLLPWGLVVIGSTDTGYFGRWGIAGSWHILVALAVLGNLGLALIENRVPVWLKTGVAGLGLGALLLGLVWPYLTLPALGGGPGALIAGIGAAALVVSGILALVTDRHAEASRPV